MLARPAHLPDAVVGQLPTVLEELEQGKDQVAGTAIVSRDPDPPGLVERIDDLSVHVELELLGRRVADSDGLGALVPGQPRRLPIRSAGALPRVRT